MLFFTCFAFRFALTHTRQIILSLFLKKDMQWVTWRFT